MVARPNFDITINYPLPENQASFEERVGKAVAKVIVETVPPEQIDELINLYKEKKKEILSNSLGGEF